MSDDPTISERPLIRFWIPEDGNLLGAGRMVYPENNLSHRLKSGEETFLLAADGKGVCMVFSPVDPGENVKTRFGEQQIIPMLGSRNMLDLKRMPIFQGDLVSVGDKANPMPAEVVFRLGMFCLLMQKEDDSPIYIALFNALQSRGGPGVVVIGNIYENPEIETFFRKAEMQTV